MRLLEYIKHVKPSYEPDWFHLAIIAELERVARGETDLLVSTPPGHGKTELIGILFPSWLVAEDPATHIISLANSDSLSRMAAGNILRIVQSPIFQEVCPIELDKASEQQFQVKGNDGRPTLHSAGINGQLTGHRAKFLLFDDLIKSLAEAYSDTVRERTWSNFNSAAETRLLPESRVVGISTRWHLDDPHGLLIKRALENPLSRQFTYLNLAAVNSGTQSYRFDTKAKCKTFLPRLQVTSHEERPAILVLAGRPQGQGSGPRTNDLLRALPRQPGGDREPNVPAGGVELRGSPQYRRLLDGGDGLGHGVERQGEQRPERERRSGSPQTGRFRGAGRHANSSSRSTASFPSFWKGDGRWRAAQDDTRCWRSKRPTPASSSSTSSGRTSRTSRWWRRRPVKSKIVRAEAVTPFTTARSVKLLQGRTGTPSS